MQHASHMYSPNHKHRLVSDREGLLLVWAAGCHCPGQLPLGNTTGTTLLWLQAFGAGSWRYPNSCPKCRTKWPW